MQTLKSIITFTQHSLLMAGIVGFLTSSCCSAGDLLGLLGHRSDCGCSQSSGPALQLAPMVHAAAPVMHHQPVVHVAPLIDNGCACSSTASACCGIGGGMMQLGGLYGAGMMYGSGHSHHGSPAPGSFLSGYEGIPNMDGGGIHHRYPYHSYRRPWAHPGTPSTNVTIVW